MGPYTEKYFKNKQLSDGLYRPQGQVKPKFQEALVTTTSKNESEEMVGEHLKFTAESKEGTFGQ